MRLILTTLSLFALSLSPALAQDKSVTVYTSVDQPHAKSILDAFQKETGIKVVLTTDTEATKSVGLAERLRAEKNNPRADVWWGNEVFHTISLAEEGLLEPYDSPGAAQVAKTYKDPKHRWTGLGLRVRVLAVAPDSAAKDIKGLEDLTHPQLKGKITLARPTAGTTGGHVAALYVLWGDEKADAYFRKLRQNHAQLLGGNSVVAQQVGKGQMWAGLTDNDDVAATEENGGKLRLVLPDQDGIGTLTIPTTVALVKGAPNPDPARKLIDYLLTRDVEKKLIDAKFAAHSVFQDQQKVKPMDVDYAAVAKKLPDAVRRATAILEAR